MPGEHRNSYVVYKRCPAALDLLLEIMNRVLNSRQHPQVWALAVMILLFKGGPDGDMSRPECFRNIALTDVEGKLFWSVMGMRLIKFLLANNYVRTTTQKGFVNGVPGCLDHSDILFSAFKNARRFHREICCAWLDFKNAYGSVKHNLIQFALYRYHIPEMMAQLIFHYHDQLQAVICTKEWSPFLIKYLMGVFQGCVLSVYLFLSVFQILLDYLQVHHHDQYIFARDDQDGGAPC